jgi:hypothetical protein
MNSRVEKFPAGRRKIALAQPVLLSVLFASALLGAARAAETPAPKSEKPKLTHETAEPLPPGPSRSGGAPPRIPEGFPDLVSGLKATPGVLGVETARTGSGKNVIFAWFKDKAAAVRWYNSDMHRTAQKRFFPNRPAHQPLALVPDDVGPIMAIASITFADSARAAVTNLPVSQIAIELYSPLPGGVFLWSRFAPDSLEVKGMLDYTPQPGR